MSEFENLEKSDEIDYLPWPDCVRVRPDTYIGGVNPAGMSVILREIIDNATDECYKTADKVFIDRDFNGLVIVADNGRGISIEYNKKVPGVISADLSISSMHSGAKFPKTKELAASKLSTTGKNGVGSSVTNALSTDYILMSWITPLNYNKSLPEVEELWNSCGPRSKKELFYIVWYKKGVKYFEGAMKKTDFEKKLFGHMGTYKPIPDGMSTIVMFNPDPEIFKESAEKAAEDRLPMGLEMTLPILNLQYFYLIQEKFLKKKVAISIDGEIMTGSGFYGYSNEFQKSVEPSNKDLNASVDFFVTFDVDGELVASKREKNFSGSVNGLVVDTGIHIDWVEKCYEKALKSTFDLDIPERYLICGLRMCVVSRASETSFGSQTKEKLEGFPGLKLADMAPLVKEFQKVFKKNEIYWTKHVTRLLEYVDSMKSLSVKAKSERMMAISGAASYALKGEKVNGFVDATVKDRQLTELFLTEGNSAASGLTSGRKVIPELGGIPQAIMPLRGKILNVKDSTVTKALENKEILTIFNYLGVGIGDNNCIKRENAKTDEEALAALRKYCRYGKIVICTDGDADGSHIQNLLIYLFAKFAPFLIKYGFLYVCRAPLFYQDGKYYFPGDPLQPGTEFPVGLDQTKHYSRWKGLGSFSPENVFDSFFNPCTRQLIRVSPVGLEYGKELTESIELRKKLLVEAGIFTNPFNL